MFEFGLGDGVQDFERSEELGDFGFGSPTIMIVGPGGPGIPTREPEFAVRMGAQT